MDPSSPAHPSGTSLSAIRLYRMGQREGHVRPASDRTLYSVHGNSSSCTHTHATCDGFRYVLCSCSLHDLVLNQNGDKFRSYPRLQVVDFSRHWPVADHEILKSEDFISFHAQTRFATKSDTHFSYKETFNNHGYPRCPRHCQTEAKNRTNGTNSTTSLVPVTNEFPTVYDTNSTTTKTLFVVPLETPQSTSRPRDNDFFRRCFLEQQGYLSKSNPMAFTNQIMLMHFNPE
jgi:hypothetical protein